MKITSLSLSGYKRLRLSSIDDFYIKITEPLQLILGSNGSGKSSLLEQLTPLPPNHQDFYKSGKKIITIENNNSQYVLSSTFSPFKHSFIKDNIELNNGNTVTVQKELVLEHFGINQEIHDLIIGKISFTSLPSNKRKEWFIKLCDTDYEYAIRVYNKIKEENRDISGALKIAKKKLTVEIEKTIKTEEQISLQEEVNLLHKSLSDLLEIRKPIDKDYESLELEQSKLDTYLNKLNTNFISIKENVLKENLSIDELNNLIHQKDLNIFSISEQISILTNSLKDINNRINILQRANSATVDSLIIDISSLKKEFNLLTQSTIAKNIIDPRVVLDSYSAIIESLNDIFINIKENKNKFYSQEKLILAKDELSTKLVIKENIITQLSASKQKKIHLLEHKENKNLECPNCNHKFSLNYNEVSFNNTLLNIDKLEKELVIVNKTIEELKTYIEDCSDYSVLIRQYFNICRNNPHLNEYWDYLNENQDIQNNPKNIPNKLNQINIDLNKQIKLFDINKEIQNKSKILEDIKTLGTDDLNSLLQKSNEIDYQLQDLTSRHISIQQEQKQLISRKNIIISYNEIVDKLKNIINKKRSLSKEQIETLRRTYFNNSIRIIQSHLSNKENILHGISIQRNIINDLEKQIVDLEKLDKSSSLLLNQLSPKDGLIAEGLLGFINSFTNQMNYFIKKIWTYPLIIKSCSIKDDDVIDLDYLFPFLVGEEKNEITDVSKGSAAMLEIINLAFRITAMQSLGLKNYPIALDEFAKTFDSVHRDAATFIIKTLVDQQIFNQVFVVSHYESIYGALPNPEICVLDSKNIVLGKLSNVINKHVIMN